MTDTAQHISWGRRLLASTASNRTASNRERPAQPHGLRTLVVGGGAAARTVIRDLRHSPEYGLEPVGCLDDDLSRRWVSGLPVLGRLADLARVIGRENAEAVVIAIPSLPAAQVSMLAQQAVGLGVHVRYLPSFLAALERVARAGDMRSVRTQALLGRPERTVADGPIRAALSGARVLVTGAGGSIGSELCRQLRRYQPAGLFMVDHDESNLHSLQLYLDGEALLDSDEVIIADIRDRRRVEQLLREVRPDVVFHAAAHKHLPLLERYPCEGVKSNVIGTENLVRAAVEVGVSRLVAISTDKAADPTSVLGATKGLAEMVVQSYAGGSTRVCSVRFGNVLGSRGSLLSVVADQLAAGTPVTVTHPDVTRYFMTVEEAVTLVLAATPMAEYGETFVLDMGDPVRIVDLIRRFAAELNLADVPFRFTGLRPGEKLHERLFGAEENRLPTAHPAIWATRPQSLDADFPALLHSLCQAADADDTAGVRLLLSELLPGYGTREAVADVVAIERADPSPVDPLPVGALPYADVY